MNSRSLGNIGFGSWAAFNHQTETVVLRGLPVSPGVYVMLLERPEKRRRGASDVAYIGRATNQNGLRGRVRQYFHPGPTQSTNIAMKIRLVAPDCSLRLGFVVSDSTATAKRLESDLLTQFEQEHGELPPFNRQRALGLVVREEFEDPTQGDGVATMRGTFRIIKFDEGGVQGSVDNRRLVCVLDGGGKLAIWGREGGSNNIDKVVRAGTPCTVECQYRAPGEVQAEKYGHTHWVRQDFDLRVVS